MTDSVDSDSKQEVYEDNDCDGGLLCLNGATNQISLTTENQADIESEAYQKIKKDNKCENAALCTNTGGNDLTLTASQQLT